MQSKVKCTNKIFAHNKIYFYIFFKKGKHLFITIKTNIVTYSKD